MPELYIPQHLAKKPPARIVFWVSRKLNHIMCPPSPLAPAPTGYEKIECRYAHEVDKWSGKLRAQEKRLREMTDEERYNFEEPIRQHGIAELRKALAKANDPVNRQFLDAAIKALERKRESRRQEVVETFMHAEAKEGVAP